MARGVRLLCEIISPPRIQDLSANKSNIYKREEKDTVVPTDPRRIRKHDEDVCVHQLDADEHARAHLLYRGEEHPIHTVKDKVRTMI